MVFFFFFPLKAGTRRTRVWEEVSKLNLRACSTRDDCGTERYRNQWGKRRRG